MPRSTGPDIWKQASTSAPLLVLASASPRRRELLADAGIACVVRPAPFDDADLPLSHPSPVAHAMALGYIKARAVFDTIEDRSGVVVLGADTLCIVDGVAIGKPRDEPEARSILRAQVGRTHRVVTGVAIVSAAHRTIDADLATVGWGQIAEGEIEAYLASGLWRGKAGGYNLTERTDAGWPITFEGEASAIVGLPMPLVLDRLAHLGIVPAGVA